MLKSKGLVVSGLYDMTPLLTELKDVQVMANDKSKSRMKKWALCQLGFIPPQLGTTPLHTPVGLEPSPPQVLVGSPALSPNPLTQL